ncbi:MAG: ABC transporter substrate-binding protein [Candidatus Omnitrophica bacterium]|nr:ABC transporter substrate-binding protein [Candidatus Omnitrophota bacterium]MCB9747837.1 ABC transporter substrate-binding protein [Candidatus Omnitrophota bacterium]
MKNKLLASLCFCLFLSSTVHAQETAGRIIVHTIEQSLELLKDPKLQSDDKLILRREKLWELLEPIFNFEEIAKRALGHHWRDCSPAEKKEFTEVFTNILKDVYLGRSDSYSGEQIIYLNEETEETRSKVYTNFITTDGKKIDIIFSMKKFADIWQIYDVIIEGVSTVGNYRTQFNSIINKESFTALMQQLKDKNFKNQEVQ